MADVETAGAGEVGGVVATSMQGYREQRRREDARYALGALGRLMDDLGSESGAYDRLNTLVEEMRADGFSDAAFHATQALPLLKEAELHLERAKGKVV